MKANRKTRKKNKIFFLFISVILFSFIIPGIAYCQTKDLQISNYDSIYNSLPKIDIKYLNNEDPDELDDYNEFIKSPYPLIRTSMNLKCKSINIPHGYYLLTPKNKSGYDFVMFKQLGKIVALVPVFEKHLIDPSLVYPESPKPKIPIYKLPFITIKKAFLFVLGKNKKSPQPPKYLLEANTVDNGKYFQVDFYFEQYLYRMLFRIED